MNERLNFKYDTSKNYEKLFELIQTQRIICIVIYSENINKDKQIELRDICSSSVLKSDSSINIGCRGTGYITAMEFDGKSLKEDFIRQCQDYKLEYIDPID